ncbi:MAG: RNA methyltransferase [Actinomycetota bacterium]|nr:RNA methyltransferase [Actinomycetota bacterium]
MSGLAFRHQKVQRLRRLLGRRSARQADRAFVVEGTKLLSEAMRAAVPIEGVYVAPDAPDDVLVLAKDSGARVHELAPGVLERVADTVAPQPVMAVVPWVDVALDTLRDASFLVVCVDVRDPGNAGTVLRSAEAAGADGVVCCDGSVDVYNPKTVRASAGTLFHIPVVSGGDPVEVLEQIGSWGAQRLGATARAGHDYAALDLTSRVAFVLGNEASGLPSHLEPQLDEQVCIPMAGRAESLNVGMAAAVLCFEAARQRRQAVR